MTDRVINHYSAPVMTPALKELSDMINVFGRIMEQEGVPKETRDRVIHTFIFGTPEHFDTKASIERGLADSAAGRVIDDPDLPWLFQGDE